MKTSNVIFKQLWRQYTEQNPAAGEIHHLFTEQGEQPVNDHIAFRTFNDSRLDIKVLSRPFTDLGYVEKGSYYFEEKHLRAKHFELPEEKLAPRVFISELVLEDFSDFLRTTIAELLDGMTPGFYQSENLIFSGSFPGTKSYQVYEKLRTESEYAAWLYVHGFRANHFTISINHLKNFKGIEEVNSFLKQNDYQLNTSGGEIKGSKKQLLKQSSTLAEITELTFSEGIYRVPACYYEFAERFPASDGKLFSGFIAGSADKIFESTDFHKKSQ